MTYTFDEALVSDIHKDAYGFRPGSGFWLCWEGYTDDEKQAEWDHLLVALDASVEQDIRDTQLAVAAFSEAVSKTMSTGGCSDWSTAVRWMLDAADYEVHEFEFYLGAEFQLYSGPERNQFITRFQQETQRSNT